MDQTRNPLRALPLLLIGVICLTGVSHAQADHSPRAGSEPQSEQQEQRCRQANETMLETMRQTPRSTPRDHERVNELIGKAERMLSDNRRAGVSECRSWGDFNQILVHQ